MTYTKQQYTKWEQFILFSKLNFHSIVSAMSKGAALRIILLFSFAILFGLETSGKTNLDKSENIIFTNEILLLIIFLMFVSLVVIVSFNSVLHRRSTNKLKRSNEEIKMLYKKLKVANDELEQSDKLKTEFLLNISHELRTPMNGIVGFVDLVIDDNYTEEEHDEFKRHIMKNAQRLATVLDEISEMSALVTGNISTHPTLNCLNTILRVQYEVFHSLSLQSGVDFNVNVSLSDEKCNFIVDREKLAQILNNLLDNAFKFTKKGSIRMGYYVEKYYVYIYVEDTGVGITSEQEQQMFKEFGRGEHDFLKKYDGLGLGLSIAKENAEILGGTISLDTDYKGGARFIVKIPFEPVKEKNQ